jgi:SAM-dependent methyltransferase
MITQKNTIVNSNVTWNKYALSCPRCQIRLISLSNSKSYCKSCNVKYQAYAEIPDFRIFSDRYLSLSQERQKALRLARYEKQMGLEDLTRYYYQITSDVNDQRRERFVRHVMDAELRGKALLSCLPKHGSILEIGCGTGGFLKPALESGRDVVGVDIALRWLVVARKRLENVTANRPPVMAAVAESLPFQDGSFETVVADSVIEHTKNPEKVICEILRVLRPGGQIFLWSPNRFYPGTDPHVGLIGLGLLPRRMAERYKTFRRGNIFLPMTRSPKQWAKLIQATNPDTLIQYQGAATRSWSLEDRSSRAKAARLAGILADHPLTASLMKHFGPIGQIVVSKPHHDYKSLVLES